MNWSHLYEIASLVALVASALLLMRAKGYVRVFFYVDTSQEAECLLFLQ